MAKSKKQTKTKLLPEMIVKKDGKDYPLKRSGGVESTHTSYFRGATIPNKFRRTQTLDELSDLLDSFVRIDSPGNMYDAEDIERMVRARVIRFYKTGETQQKPPKSRDLQCWQEWFMDLKATPTATDNGKELLNEDIVPGDLINLKHAMITYNVNRDELLREIKAGRLRSYRDKGKKATSPHRVSHAALVRYGMREVVVKHKYPSRDSDSKKTSQNSNT